MVDARIVNSDTIAELQMELDKDIFVVFTEPPFVNVKSELEQILRNNCGNSQYFIMNTQSNGTVMGCTRS